MNSIQNQTVENNASDLSKIKNNLIEKIKKTKNTRIRSYNRCVYWNNMLSVMNSVYSALVVLLSIMSLAYNGNNRFIQYGLICLSITSLVFSLIVNNVNYAEKSRDYKESFNSLEKLLSDLNSLENLNINDLKQIENLYNHEMSSRINHKDVDYFQYMIDIYSEKIDTLSAEEKIKFKDIKKKYIKYKSMEFANKIIITLGLYAIYALLYHIIIIFKKMSI